MRTIILIFILTSFLSCKNMYSKIFDKEEAKRVSCLKIEGNDMFLNNKVSSFLSEEGIKISENCPYTLKVYALKLSQCNTPVGKSIGADFDGYIRFSIFKDKKLVYRCQEDYKGEFEDSLIKDLVGRMKKDIFSKD